MDTLFRTHYPGKASYPSTIIPELLKEVGVGINGSNPWDMQVFDSLAYDQILSKWSLGLGESYMDGLWDCDQLDEMLNKLLRADLNSRIHGLARARFAIEVVRAKVVNLQSKSRACQVADQHYDIGNDVFELMLDPRMIYSCGYWEHAKTLAQAQEHKLELICKKLHLKPGETLLDIGCGWGGLAEYAARHYGVSVLGVTISKEQQRLAIERCLGLPVTIELIDYRDLSGSFDKIVSVGMFEHVGEKNYPVFFETVNRLLKDEGIFLLHTIGSDVTVVRTDPWIDRYIFPNGKIPSAVEITQSFENIFLIEDWHNFGQDYDKTLMAWHHNFVTKWPQIAQKYGPRFYRMWSYYLLGCAAFFRSRQGQLWQIILSKRTKKETYRSIRMA
jgi:cyclopropane-fatty-acyl-phospholipid synthase